MAVRADENGAKYIHFSQEYAKLVSTWGNLDNLEPGKYFYSVEVYAQSITGSRITLWTGNLAG